MRGAGASAPIDKKSLVKPESPNVPELCRYQTNKNFNSARTSITGGAADSPAVIEGPFANFQAKVEEVKADKQKLKVSLSFLGRPTTVELDFAQVEKA